jgi:hypothetical protein
MAMVSMGGSGMKSPLKSTGMASRVFLEGALPLRSWWHVGV